jgi:anthranilate phosphoribosyltransferase
MSKVFRELLKTIGSGPHTGKNLDRSQAAEAMRLMLTQAATPAQIGAFLIAHRIKRPTGEELAGMLDAYAELGPRFGPIALDRPLVSFGIPYDGRSRTAPLGIATGLILAAAGFPLLFHGGDRMATKYGITLTELWQALGLDWTRASWEQVERCLAEQGLTYCYVPKHFPETVPLAAYRDEIGKRPPLATLELLWSPYQGPQHRVMGFVHPPTEQMMRDALALHQIESFTTVKGLEGSPDLPHDRTVITGLGQPGRFDRLCLNPWDLGYSQGNLPLGTAAEWAENLSSLFQGSHGQDHPWRTSVIWNAGFYLWRLNSAGSDRPTDFMDSTPLKDGLAQAATILDQGLAWQKLLDLRSHLMTITK